MCVYDPVSLPGIEYSWTPPTFASRKTARKIRPRCIEESSQKLARDARTSFSELSRLFSSNAFKARPSRRSENPSRKREHSSHWGFSIRYWTLTHFLSGMHPMDPHGTDGTALGGRSCLDMSPSRTGHRTTSCCPESPPGDITGNGLPQKLQIQTLQISGPAMRNHAIFQDGPSEPFEVVTHCCSKIHWLIW